MAVQEYRIHSWLMTIAKLEKKKKKKVPDK